MRLMVMTIAGTALVLSACGSKSEDGNVAADAGMTAEAITANDVTAIDAVTGDASNMAADVDFSAVPEVNSTDGNSSRAERPRPRPGRPSESAAPRPATPEPASEDAPANTTE